MKPDGGSDRRTVLASASALISAGIAWSCCLPLFPFLAAAGVAGSSTFLTVTRPYLLAAAVLLIGFGFYQARRAQQCNRRVSKISTALLWFSAVAIGVSILFPQAIAELLAG